MGVPENIELHCLQGTRILDAACDATIDKPHQVLDLWNSIEKDAVGRFYSHSLAKLVFWFRQVAIALRHNRATKWLAYPLNHLISWIQSNLSKTLLLSCEVTDKPPPPSTI